MTKQGAPPLTAQYTSWYEGRRFWVVENNPENPIEGWTGDHELIAYDRQSNTVAAVGKWRPAGTVEAKIVWPIQLGIIEANNYPPTGNWLYVVWFRCPHRVNRDRVEPAAGPAMSAMLR
jgi:hypothetical protein